MKTDTVIQILKIMEMEEEDPNGAEALRIAIESVKSNKVKIGYWIASIDRDDYGDSYVKCSVCEEPNGTYVTNYCPDCGTKMMGVIYREKKDETEK